MGNNVLARQQGDEYQANFFWLQACKLLLNSSGINKVQWELEGDSTKGFDDVVITYENPQLDAGNEIYFDCFQLKYHVDHSKMIQCESLINPEFIGAKNHTLLGRIYENYRSNPSVSNISRFNLVTTYVFDPKDDLKSLLGKGGAIRLNQLFAGGDRSKMGKIRKLWRDHLGVEDSQLKEILKCLRIKHNFDSETLVEQLSSALEYSGLKPLSHSGAINSYVVLIQKLHSQGNNSFSKSDFLKICKNYELHCHVVISPEEEKEFALKSFEKGTEHLDNDGIEILDLTSYFDQRNLKLNFGWNDLYSSIKEFSDRIINARKPIKLYLDSHLSLSFALGSFLDSKCGIEIAIVQKLINGRVSWKPDMDKLIAEDLTYWNWEEIYLREGKFEVAFSIGVTHSIVENVKRYIASELPNISLLLNAETKPFPSNSSFGNVNHIILAIQEANYRLREMLNKADNAPKLHLFISAPGAFAFYLGRYSKSWGEITLYEFEFEKGVSGTYKQSITL